MEWLVTSAGALVVMAVLIDIFHTLWHPTGQGRLSRTVFRTVWALSRRWRDRRLDSLTGPLAMVAVVGAWAGLAVLGWMLVYWPHMPEAFSFSPGLQPVERADLLDALYLSMVTVATLGFGDIVPREAWLRAAAPLQGLVGFILLTAAVSWVLQVYPALGRRRSLANRLTLLRGAGAAEKLPDLDSASAAQMLHDVAAELVAVRVDLTQYAETYYFRDAERGSSLPEVISHAAELADAGSRSARDDVRLAAEVLQGALDGYADVLRLTLPPSGTSTADVLSAYAADHGGGIP